MPKIDTDNGTLHYELIDATPRWLEAPETILFHHGVAIDSGIWGGWLPVLADRYRILTFDVRGYGRSNIPEENFKWSFELMAKDVMSVADANGVNKFHFVGESMGGAMGLYLAIHHPERLLTITPCTCPHKGGGSPVACRMERIYRQPWYCWLVRPDDGASVLSGRPA